MKMISKLLQKMIHENGPDACDENGQSEILPEHILLGILKEKRGIAYEVFKTYNFNLLALKESLENFLASCKESGKKKSGYRLGKRFSTALGRAEGEATTLSCDYVGTEHFLLACILEEGSTIQKHFILSKLKIDEVRQKIKEIQITRQKNNLLSQSAFNALMNNTIFSQKARQDATFQQKDVQNEQRQKSSFVLQNTKDLTALATQGKLDPVIGRDSQTSRIIQVLSRRTKNNAILIGEAGVGKTSIVEGLAQRIASKNVPRQLLKKRVLSLDLSGLVAGSRLRGDFEEKMKKLILQTQEAGDIILFIDEIHTIIGAGSSEGTMDAANLLKPALAAGLQCIGATSTKEYRKYFEKDAALARRFQCINIEEPSICETELILKGIRSKFEAYHSVSYSDEVLSLIAKYSSRYISDRFLPDTAIDVMDEAGAMKKIEDDCYPKEFSQIEKSIEELKSQKEQLVKNQDYEQAAVIRDKALQLKKQLDDFVHYWENCSEQNRKPITTQDVKQVIHSMTNIPVEQLDKDESKKLLDMENELGKVVVGQDEAVKAVSSCIRRNRTGVSSCKRPQGSFVFLGPTGVGKTYLAKTLAKFLFGKEDALIRIDMSDYMEKHDASRLVGAPPGYIGYDDGGQLTEQVRQKPYSVILFDEVEKAHSAIHNLLLQILEEGELKDNFGHSVNFRNCVIIMTSNAGANEILGTGRAGFLANDNVSSFKEMQEYAKGELKKIFTPEILNRIDDVLVFHTLSQKQIEAIATLQLQELQERLSSLHLRLEVSNAAKKYLVKNGFDVSMGARPMRRLITKQIEEPISVCLLKAQPFSSAIVEVTEKKDELHIALKTLMQNVQTDTKKDYAEYQQQTPNKMNEISLTVEEEKI